MSPAKSKKLNSENEIQNLENDKSSKTPSKLSFSEKLNIFSSYVFIVIGHKL